MREQLTFPLSADGLALEVRVGLPAPLLEAKLAQGESFRAAETVRALIDTGADAMSVAPRVLTQLGLTPTGEVEMTTASGSVMVKRYEISLTVFGNLGVAGPVLVRPVWNVTAFSRPLTNIEALIGMDLIRQILLKVDGPGKTFTLEF
jgi:predicted aspartyl protease